MRSIYLLQTALLFSSPVAESWRPVLIPQSRRRATRLQHDFRPALTTRPTAGRMQLGRGGNTSSPKLTTWIGPALSSALSYALYNIFIKLGSASIHPVLGGVILQFVAALLGSCLLGASRDKLTFDSKGVLWSVCAGIFVGLAEILSFQVSGMGVEASKSIPVMIGGSVAFGSVIGFFLLQERMTKKGWFGVLLVVLGVICVAADPGAKLASH